MITNVSASGFKGQDFSIDLSERTFLRGPNGSGKSSVWQAMTFCRYGFLPGGSKKINDVAKKFSSGQKMSASVTHGAVVHERTITLKNGSYKQSFKIGTRKAVKADFDAAMTYIPGIMDLSHFMGLSDQKKIDAVFDLFPPDDDFGDLDDKIESLKEKRNDLIQKNKETQGARSRLVQSISEIELPAGSLSEVRGEKEKVTAQWKEVNQQIKEAEQAAHEAKVKSDAEAKAKLDAEKAEQDKIAFQEQATKDAEAKAVADLAKQKKEEVAAKVKKEQELRQGSPHLETKKINEEWFDPIVEKKHQMTDPMADTPSKHVQTTPSWVEQVACSFEKIIKAMDDSGCEYCAAKMVARAELKKIRKVVA